MSSHTALAYPDETQYERWQRKADEWDMTMSEFIQSTVEAGIKSVEGVDITIEADENIHEIREERNRLASELGQAQSRISELEEQTFSPEREELRRFLVENPDADYSEVIEHMRATIPSRILELVEGLYVDLDAEYEWFEARQEDRS